MDNRAPVFPDDLGVTKAARWLGVDPRTVRRMIHRGQLPGAYNYGRDCKWFIPIEALDDKRSWWRLPPELRVELAGEE